MALRGFTAVSLAILFAIACGGGSEEAGQPSQTASTTPGATASRGPTPQATPEVTAEPVDITAAPAPPTEVPQPAATAPPTQPPAPPANSAPAFPDPINISTDTSFEYDDEGRLMGAVTTIAIPAATDPDGDSLSYSWSASSGSISGAGLTATWTRDLEYGEPAPGTVTVTVTDGRGGSDTIQIQG